MVRPSGLYYKTCGKLVCGFMCDRNGQPYLLAYISYDGSENLLDNYRDDRGREFQSCLLDGFINHILGDTFWINTTNPTHGGGDYGRAIPTVTMFTETLFTLEAELPAYDYMPHNYGGEMKPYKAGMLAGRYPATGWSCRIKYTMKANSVFMDVEYFITDGRLHNVYFFRPMVLHLNPLLFDHDLVNENKRDTDSFLQAVIRDDYIMARSVDNKIQVKATAGVTSPSGLSTYYSHRCFRQANRTVPAPPGTDDVWEAMLVTEPMKFYNARTVFKGWAKIELQPVKLGFDLATVMRNIKNALIGRKSKMRINCKDGHWSVSEGEFLWLKFEEKLTDMSSNPMAPENEGFYSGTIEDLKLLLDTIPEGWGVPVPIPPDEPVVDPPATKEFEEAVIERLDRVLEILEELRDE